MNIQDAERILQLERLVAENRVILKAIAPQYFEADVKENKQRTKAH